MLAGEPLERVERVERLARGHAVGVELGERFGERVGGGFGRRRGGEQRQVVEPGGDPAGRVAAGLELGEHRLGAGEDDRRQPGELGDGDAVAAVGGAFGDFVEQDQIALPFARADMVERQRVEPVGEPRQLVIMGREQGAAARWSCIASTTAQAIASPS